ncbi:hypothetical protein [Candidatus Avelusimicrobium luingense]|uniref:hypothetical protein n=1 Tax=Candidatus Avelusimicrobium luingense TaxID=3416211 RepID=UPI003D12D3F6
MTEKSTLRSGMLSTIYKMLPAIDDDYAARLVYTLEDKKTLPQLEQDIANISAQLGSDSPSADTLVAQMLLDEITLPAALRQLRIYNNALSIGELCDSLEVSSQDTQLLVEVYASFSSRKYFDEAFANALKTLPQGKKLTDVEKAQHAVDTLLQEGRQWLEQQNPVVKKNKQEIFTLADKYHLPLKITAQLQERYTHPGSIAFEPEFMRLVGEITKQNPDENLATSLAAHVMLGNLTLKDASETALVSKLVDGQILEEDLLIIACRYLKVKTPADIVATFKAVLSKLPHVADPAENLGLAVRVLLDGTAASFDYACRKAALRQERELLRRNLTQNELYAGYEQDLSVHFGGKKTFTQLEKETEEILQNLPFCVEKTENKELACKVLLGTLSQEEAAKQAQYLRDLKAKSLTQGLAPEVMKSYLGTKSAEEILEFFDTSLAPYTFWKSDREKHEFVLRVLLGELNGHYNRQISQFVLEMLENGSSLELMTDMLSNIQTRKTSKEDLDNLLSLYKQARANSKA